MYGSIIDHISRDFQNKKFKTKDNIIFVREKQEENDQMVFILYVDNNKIEICNELEDTQSIIRFNNWLNDWNEFKSVYWCIIDEYFNEDFNEIGNITNLMSSM